jgi:hypothetical protein
VTTPKKAAAARRNGLRAAAHHAARAGRSKPGSKLSAKIIDHAARYQKARADKEEQIARRQKINNDERARLLIPSTEVRDWERKMVAGIRHELDQIKLHMLAAMPDPALVEAITVAAAKINERMRQKLQAVPALVRGA